MDDQLPADGSMPMKESIIALLIPPTLDFGPGPFPELAPPELALRHARHRFMYAAFTVSPWPAASALRILHPLYLEALVKAGLWKEILLLTEAHLNHPDPRSLEPPGYALQVLCEWLHLKSWEDLTEIPFSLPDEVVFLRDVLYAWADEWHLTDPWCLDWVLVRLHDWTAHLIEHFLHELGPLEKGKYLDGGFCLAQDPRVPWEDTLVLEARNFRPSELLWEPHLESKAEARSRALAAYAAGLDQQFEHITQTLETRGWQPVSRRPNARHYEWLVRYQVHEESLSEIARSDHFTLSAVSEAVHKLRDVMGLTLRKALPGRPRGTKDSRPRRSRKRR